jgi:hypothetical protein
LGEGREERGDGRKAKKDGFSTMKASPADNGVDAVTPFFEGTLFEP